jgi:flavin-dependent thymidylate synthase
VKVTLLSKTPDAAALLLFTKETRLNMTAASFRKFADELPVEQIMAGLRYMANTIPSSWEFVDYVFLIEGVSRAYTHQQVRTRAGSYAQQSLRVVDAEGFDYVWPTREISTRARSMIEMLNGTISNLYRRLIDEEGFANEDARGILPTNIATNIVCKFNLRTLSELAKSRTGGRTQGEYIAVVNALLDAVLAVHPWASMFLFPKPRDYFAEIEAFAEREYAGDLVKKGELLKIVDALRKEA